jgi:hypothetical protein
VCKFDQYYSLHALPEQQRSARTIYDSEKQGIIMWIDPRVYNADKISCLGETKAVHEYTCIRNRETFTHKQLKKLMSIVQHLNNE